MTDLTRREALTLAVGAAAALALPPTAEAALAPLPLPEPAWVVGTPGEFNWQHITAKTAEEAKRIFLAEWVTDSCEGEEDAPCGECEACTLDVEADRVKIWDGKAVVTSGDWLEAGMGAICSRCSYECFTDTDAHNVSGDAVCMDCMRLADWDIVDPERAAEFRAEAAEI